MNLAGVRQMAWFQNVTVILKFLPLLFVGVLGGSSSRTHILVPSMLQAEVFTAVLA